MEDLRDFVTAKDALAGLGADLGEKQAVCDKHGPYTSTGKRWLRNVEVWSKCPSCEAEAIAAEAERKREAQAIARQRQIEEAMQDACIPRRFIGRTLETFDAPTDEMRHARTVATDYANNFKQHLEDGTGLIFGGLPGTGKSHLAIGILQAILPEYVGLYVTCAGVIRAVRSTWGGKSDRTESEIMRTLTDVPLLVLDEVGVQMGTDNEQNIIFGVLDARYRDMRPTIILTNQNTDGLTKYLGERSYDRLRETSKWVQFNWKSYRGRQ